MKKITTVLLLLALCLLLVGCGKEEKYEQALVFFQEGNYTQALEIFESLEEFEDSSVKANECKYFLATEKMNNGLYDEAIKEFSALGSFKDATQKVTACQAQIDPFGTLYDYYVENHHYTGERYLDGMYSLTGEGVYMQGVEGEDLLFTYIAREISTVASVKLSKDQTLSIIVVIETGTEKVRGSIKMPASEYDPTIPLKKFKYEASGTRWNYEGFEARANAYIRNTLNYAAFQIHSMDIGLSLQALGLTSFNGTGELNSDGFISDNDLAGLWQTEDGSRLYYFSGDSVYSGFSSSSIGEILKNNPWGGNLKTSIYDPVIGMKVIAFDNTNEKWITRDDTYHCFAWRETDGNLYLRIESQVHGLGTELDGRILVKLEDEGSPTITPGKIERVEESSEDDSVYNPKTYTMEGIDTSGASISAIQALERAISYLNVMAFSHSGLIEQLEYEGFFFSDALFAADHCGADWNTEAQRKALAYIKTTAFSRDGLVEQLEYEGFTHEQAVYGADNINIDWYIQAIRKANQYLDLFSFSYQELIDQLEYEGFTYDEALYALEEIYS